MLTTRKGVYKNIEDSTYKLEISRIDNIELYFSSKYYKYLFETQYEEYIKENIKKMDNKFNIKTENLLDTYFIIAFYKKIEKRGFRVYVNSIRIDENYL